MKKQNKKKAKKLKKEIRFIHLKNPPVVDDENSCPRCGYKDGDMI